MLPAIILPWESKKLLIVEDKPVVTDLIAIDLKAKGCLAEAAKSPRPVFRKPVPILPDLLLLDIILQPRAAFPLCLVHLANKKLPRVLIIFLAAKAERADDAEYLESGADDYRGNPRSPKELLLRVKSILRWLVAPKKSVSAKLPIATSGSPAKRFGVAPHGRFAPMERVGYKPDFLARITERRAALHQELLALLPARQSVVWEIGSGHGHFLVQYAQVFPAKYCVGVDIIRDRLARSGRKRERAQVTNCHFVQAEAREFLDALPNGVTLEEIWVLFPDPWPKKRHHKNRILQAEFIEALAGRAGEGSRLYFRTDHDEYFHAVATLLPGLKTWRLDPASSWPLVQETVFQARARAYQSLVAVRTSHPARPVETTVPRPPPRVGPR